MHTCSHRVQSCLVWMPASGHSDIVVSECCIRSTGHVNIKIVVVVVVVVEVVCRQAVEVMFVPDTRGHNDIEVIGAAFRALTIKTIGVTNVNILLLVMVVVWAVVV